MQMSANTTGKNKATKTMHVLLIDPPFYEEVALGKSGGLSMSLVQNVIPSLGLAYLAAVLEKESHQVKIIDCSIGLTHDSLRGILDTDTTQPDIVGITATTPVIASAKSVAEIVRAVYKNCLIVIGGVHVTSLPEETLAGLCFDVGVLGEGEYTFLELVQRFNSEGPACFSSIKGLAYRVGSHVVVNEKRPLIKNLDELPLPARHLLPPLAAYHPTPASYVRLPVGVLMSSRGCPYQCSFCDRSVFGVSYRMRSVDKILDEMEELIHVYGAREIRFFDDTITVNKNKLFELVDKMKQRGINVPWTALSRVDAITPDVLQKLKEGGCWQILVGVESGDDRMLQIMNKGVTVEQNSRAIKLMNAFNIEVRADLLVGVPGETTESLQKTLDFVLNHDLDYACFNKFVPFPSLELTRELQAKGYSFDLSKGSSILDIDSDSIFVPDTLDEAEYRAFLKSVHKKFYLRPSYILKRLFRIKTFEQFKGQVKGFFAIQGG